MLSVIKNSQFNKLCIAQVISDFAAWVDVLVVSVLLVYYWNANPYVQALYFIILASAYLLGSLLSSFLIDFTSPKKILLLCNVFRMSLMLLYSLTTTSYPLLILVFLKTFANAFYDPVTQVVIRYNFENDNLIAANGISNSITQSVKVIAPMVGGGLLALMHPKTIFIYNAGLYLVSSLVLLFMADIKRQPAILNKKIFNKNKILVIIRHITADKNLSIVIGISCILNFAIFISESFYVMLFNSLSIPTTKVGFLFSIVGIGGVLGGIFSDRILSNVKDVIAISLTSLTAGVSIFLMALFSAQWIPFNWLSLVIPSFMFGLSTSLFAVLFYTVIQIQTPHELIGGVSSLVNGLQMIFILSGPIVGSLLIAHSAVSAPFFCSSILCIFIALFIPVLNKFFHISLSLKLKRAN